MIFRFLYPLSYFPQGGNDRSEQVVLRRLTDSERAPSPLGEGRDGGHELSNLKFLLIVQVGDFAVNGFWVFK
jgi:hypothetical protein